MTCPVCAVDVPPEPLVANLTICQGCGRSLVLEPDGLRLATGGDTRSVSAAEIKRLKVRRREVKGA